MKVLGIFAHREDHIVFGWPIMQSNEYDKYLFICTNDAIEEIKESCRIGNIKYVGNACMPNGFTMQAGRDLPLRYENTTASICEAIKMIKPDCLFTHNPMGEYGHYDHKFLFDLVANEFPNINLFITDIIAESSYYYFSKKLPRQYTSLYAKAERIKQIKPDIDFYKKHAEIYSRNNMWTENDNLNPPRYPNSAGLYLIKKVP